MPAHHFYFALEFSSQGVSAAAHVLTHVGSSKEAVPELTASLQKAVAQGSASADRRCDVRFHAQPDKLEIVVSSNGGRIWQTSIPLS